MLEGFEMRFCRRCGGKLAGQGKHVFRCPQGHTLYANASPAVGIMLVNDAQKVLLLERALEPAKGMLDFPGGFCDGFEPLEAALAREIQEEVGLLPEDYTQPEYVLSGVDPYEYEGEPLPVLGVIFYARLRTSKQPVAADDAASAAFIPVHQVDLSKVSSSVVRDALEWLQRQ